MKVVDAMTPREDVVTVSLPGTREDVLTYLQEREFTSVPVVKETDEGEEYRGLISRGDLIAEPDEDQLAMLMRDVPTIESDASLTDAARLMVSERARRLPVVHKGVLEGIVTVTDIVRTIAEGDADGEESVAALASRDVNTTYEATPLAVAEREIALAQVPYALVLDDEAEMSGILTEADIIDVARVVEGEEGLGSSLADEDDEWKWESIKGTGGRYLPTRNVELPAERVSEFMTADPETVTGHRSSREAAQRMLELDVEQLPLVDGDELVGIVRDIDLLSAL